MVERREISSVPGVGTTPSLFGCTPPISVHVDVQYVHSMLAGILANDLFTDPPTLSNMQDMEEATFSNFNTLGNISLGGMMKHLN